MMKKENRRVVEKPCPLGSLCFSQLPLSKSDQERAVKLVELYRQSSTEKQKAVIEVLKAK